MANANNNAIKTEDQYLVEAVKEYIEEQFGLSKDKNQRNNTLSFDSLVELYTKYTTMSKEDAMKTVLDIISDIIKEHNATDMKLIQFTKDDKVWVFLSNLPDADLLKELDIDYKANAVEIYYSQELLEEGYKMNEALRIEPRMMISVDDHEEIEAITDCLRKEGIDYQVYDTFIELYGDKPVDKFVDKLEKAMHESGLLIEELDEDLQMKKSEEISKFIEELYDLRKESIANEGEYGLGNLVFKEFRNLGYLDNLKELKNKEKSDELSLK